MGFLGFGNYAKPGKGVKKEESQKKRFFLFFELFFRKFSKMIQLNLLFILFCVPSIIVGFGGIYLLGITMGDSHMFSLLSGIVVFIAVGFTGPATAGLMKIAKCFSEERPVFLTSDFYQAFKENFRPGLIVGFINSALIFIVTQSFLFYYSKALVQSLWYWVPLVIIMFIGLVSIMANFFTFLSMVSVNVSVKGLIKNSVSLAFLGAKTNFITLFFVLLILVPCILYIPLTIPVFLLLTFSLVALIVAFNSFQYIYKYCIRPYYLANGLQDPYESVEEEDEPIFEDAT